MTPDAAITRYSRLIWSVAYRYVKAFPRMRGSEEDLYQEGAFSLCRGCHLIVDDKQTTIAWFLITRGMRHYLRRTTKIPLEAAHKDFSEVVSLYEDFNPKGRRGGDNRDRVDFLGESTHQPDVETMDRVRQLSALAESILGPKTLRALFVEDDPHRELRRKGIAKLREAAHMAGLGTAKKEKAT